MPRYHTALLLVVIVLLLVSISMQGYIIYRWGKPGLRLHSPPAVTPTSPLQYKFMRPEANGLYPFV